MQRIFTFILMFVTCSVIFAQTNKQQSAPSKKYIIKVSPTLKFNFISPKMTNNNYFSPFSSMSTGFSADFLIANKKNNYNDFGASIEVIPLIIKKPQYYNTGTGYRIGFEYSHRFVLVVKKKPNVSFFTAVGTQTNFSKIQSADYNLIEKTNVYSSKSFEQNVVLTPGLQYSKNNFFLDFSLPVGIGYNYTKQLNKTGNPVFLESDSNKQFHLMNWNVGCKLGVGAKF